MEDKLQTFRLALGIAGNITSVLLYSSPILTFRRVIRNRSTEDFSCVPYIVTLLTVLLYFWYGMPVVSYKWENITVVSICGVGALLQSSFILIYIWFAPPKTKKMVILMVVGVIMVILMVSLVSSFALHDHHHRKIFVGSIGLMVAVGMYSSPLVAVKQVIQTKSLEFMPFCLSLFSFLNGSLWGPYGVLGRDIFVALPNLLGIPISLFQLVLYCIYRNREVHDAPSDTDIEMNVKKTVPEIGDQQSITNL